MFAVRTASAVDVDKYPSCRMFWEYRRKQENTVPCSSLPCPSRSTAPYGLPLARTLLGSAPERQRFRNKMALSFRPSGGRADGHEQAEFTSAVSEMHVVHAMRPYSVSGADGCLRHSPVLMTSFRALHLGQHQNIFPRPAFRRSRRRV